MPIGSPTPQMQLGIAPPRLVFDRSERGELLDLQRLRETRMFIGGGSGSGKSILIRYTAEAWAKTLVQLHVDWEGDYVTLREVHHYVWIGAIDDGADLAVSAATARRDCRQTIGIGASVVLDLSSVDDDVEKRRIAALWFDEILRRKWDGLIVYVDEAQEFAPERGKDDDFPCSLPLRRLVARGRRLGVFMVTASQRIAETHKRLLEVGNRVFGRTTLDVDVDRVAKVLDLSRAQKAELQTIAPCTYFAKGAAIGGGSLVHVAAGEVRSSHPDPLSVPLRPPATPADMAEALAALRSEKHDDPEEASRQELQELVTRLRQEIDDLKSGRGTEGVIAAAVTRATSPLNDQIHALRLQVERARQSARAILLDAGELPPIGGMEKHDEEIRVPDDHDRARPNEEGSDPAEERIPVGRGLGHEERSGKAKGDHVGLNGTLGRDAYRGDDHDRDPHAERAGIEPGNRADRAERVIGAMLAALRKHGEILSDDLAFHVGMSPTSSQFRLYRKTLVDRGQARYTRRGYIAPVVTT